MIKEQQINNQIGIGDGKKVKILELGLKGGGGAELSNVWNLKKEKKLDKKADQVL